ncbi:MAG: TolC family protein [Candidatus Riflebacteria bacterium]|nr:TolC family protein [Candidatus Riflebacteria bacterium]
MTTPSFMKLIIYKLFPWIGSWVASILLILTPTMDLSLAQALHIAMDQSPEIQQSLLDIAKSQADRKIARAAFLPSADANLFQQRTRVNEDTWTGTSTKGGPMVLGPYTWGQIGFSTNIPLFDRSLWNRWKAAEHTENSDMAKARITRESLAALVVGQYLLVQRADESVKAAQSRVELAQSLTTLAMDQQKNNVGTKLDTLRSQVQLQNERQRLIQAQSRLQITMFGLIKLLNIEPTTRLHLTDDLPVSDSPQWSFRDAYESGLKQRPELASLNAREKAARRLEKSARSERLPSLVLTGAYGSAGLLNEPYIPTAQIYVGLRMPILSGGRISADIAKAKAELKHIREEHRDFEAKVGLEIQVAQSEMETSRSEVEVSSEAVSLAEEELVQARHRFEAGVSNNIDVVNAQDELAKATDSRIEALYHLKQAHADFARAMGRLEPLFAR